MYAIHLIVLSIHIISCPFVPIAPQGDLARSCEPPLSPENAAPLGFVASIPPSPQARRAPLWDTFRYNIYNIFGPFGPGTQDA